MNRLIAQGWLDEDGEHVWFAHDCVNGREVTMLPNGPWRASADHQKIEPSVACGACGMHVFVPLGPKPLEVL